MNDFSKMRVEYEKITASDALKKRIAARSHPAVWKKLTAIAAALVMTATLGVNLSPPVAQALCELPVIGAVVRVLTFGRYVHSENGYEADIVTPRLEGLADKKLEEKLNNQFKENADALIASYEKDIRALKAEFGEAAIHMGIESNYIVKTDNDRFLALDVYIFGAAGSSWIKHSFYTIDKQTHELITLKSLFAAGADYVTPLSDYISSEMRRLNREQGGMFWVGSDDNDFEGFDKISPEHNFYINSDGEIVICFDKYDVAAGAQGSPEFVIPSSVTADIRK